MIRLFLEIYGSTISVTATSASSFNRTIPVERAPGIVPAAPVFPYPAPFTRIFTFGCSCFKSPESLWRSSSPERSNGRIRKEIHHLPSHSRRRAGHDRNLFSTHEICLSKNMVELYQCSSFYRSAQDNAVISFVLPASASVFSHRSVRPFPLPCRIRPGGLFLPFSRSRAFFRSSFRLFFYLRCPSSSSLA